MKKIALFLLTAFAAGAFLTLPIFANESGEAAARAPKSLSAETVACVQAAVEARDTAVIAAMDTFSSSVKTALTARKDALKAGWALPTLKDVRAALKIAWAAYVKSFREARQTLKDDKKTAWDAFKSALKSCKGVEKIDSAGSNVDAGL